MLLTDMLSKTSLTQIKDTLNVFSSSTVTQADQWLPGDSGCLGTLGIGRERGEGGLPRAERNFYR